MIGFTKLWLWARFFLLVDLQILIFQKEKKKNLLQSEFISSADSKYYLFRWK